MAGQDNSILVKDRLFIGGCWRKSVSGATFAVRNPANGEIVATVADAGGQDAKNAVADAYAAQGGWRAVPAKQRGQILYRWYELILENQEALARLITTEQGKPLAESRLEVVNGAAAVQWFAEEAKRCYGDVIAANSVDQRILTLKQPIGVVAAISPWNFPVSMVTRKVAPALAVGCTVVLKPSPETPLSALALAELSAQAGMPPGVFNVLCGTDSNAIGRVLTSDTRVRKLTFTGSNAVGKLLMKQCADTVKNVSLELGGNAPFIVFDDADLDTAVSDVIAVKFRNAGQTCICANRILVQNTIYDEFAQRVAAQADSLRLGNGMREDVDVGPLINARAIEKVKTLVEDAVAHGAEVISRITSVREGDVFVQPMVLTEVDAQMRVCREEIFGPVAPLLRFKTEEEAVKMANDTEQGLAAYLYTRDVNRIFRVSEALEFGMVGVNENVIATEVAPFGGIKQSGIGREGSRYGVDEYLEIKYVCLGDLK